MPTAMTQVHFGTLTGATSRGFPGEVYAKVAAQILTHQLLAQAYTPDHTEAQRLLQAFLDRTGLPHPEDLLLQVSSPMASFREELERDLRGRPASEYPRLIDSLVQWFEENPIPQIRDSSRAQARELAQKFLLDLDQLLEPEARVQPGTISATLTALQQTLNLVCQQAEGLADEGREEVNQRHHQISDQKLIQALSRRIGRQKAANAALPALVNTYQNWMEARRQAETQAGFREGFYTTLATGLEQRREELDSQIKLLEATASLAGSIEQWPNPTTSPQLQQYRNVYQTSPRDPALPDSVYPEAVLELVTQKLGSSPRYPSRTLLGQCIVAINGLSNYSTPDSLFSAVSRFSHQLLEWVAELSYEEYLQGRLKALGVLGETEQRQAFHSIFQAMVQELESPPVRVVLARIQPQDHQQLTRVMALGVYNRDDSRFASIPPSDTRLVSTDCTSEMVLRAYWVSVPPAALAQATTMISLFQDIEKSHPVLLPPLRRYLETGVPGSLATVASPGDDPVPEHEPVPNTGTDNNRQEILLDTAY